MLARDFDYWWNQQGEWVETPNERRSGWSGVLRVVADGKVYYVKRQRNHLCRTVRHPLGWPTASREWYYLMRLRDLGVPVPAPVFHGVRRTSRGVEAVLVTEELTGYVALSEQRDLSPAQYDVLATEIGLQLGALHGARLQHGCLYDKHIMVRWSDGAPQIALIDLEKMHARLLGRSAASHDLEQLQRRQCVLDERAWRRLKEAHDRRLRAA